MRARYGCVCFAVPKKLIQHLADRSGDEGHKQMLQAQITQSAAMRGTRASKTVAGVATNAGAKPLQRSVFDAAGQTFLPGKLLRDEDDPAGRDKDANEAYDNLGIALQFFSSVMGRNSVDNKGMRVDASVHYGFHFANAMWTGEQMVVGDGDGRAVKNLSGSLGILAHEFCHGVSQHLVPGGLGVVQVAGMPPALKGEAGALNESFSDVFASMIKQWHAGQDVKAADWLLGEDIFTPREGRAVRSLKEPGNTKLTWREDDQIRDYRQYKATDDAHRGSGIPNYAFYTAAAELEGKSWETLGQVWLKGFDQLRARSTFLDAAHATLNVAATLHGKGSGTHNAVKAGWKKVNVLA
ncbi:MAG: M4 family metallopeptidase [Burkholderiales bacterium]|nr:M4 family metallopeptidase [Burkholderiales bacterium]